MKFRKSRHIWSRKTSVKAAEKIKYSWRFGNFKNCSYLQLVVYENGLARGGEGVQEGGSPTEKVKRQEAGEGRVGSGTPKMAGTGRK